MKVITISVSPFAIAFLGRTSSVESIPIKSIVNGSVTNLPAEAVSTLDVSDSFICFSLLVIILVSSLIFSYPGIKLNVSA